MASCEKCWVAAHTLAASDQTSVVEAYTKLVSEAHLCTPEEQAGPGAGICVCCGRKALHQHAGECMAGCGRA